MFSYFDLNVRAENARKKLLPKFGIKSLTGTPPISQMSVLHQIFMYIGILIGVIFSTAVNLYYKTGSISLTITASQIFIAFVIALLIVPSVYEKLSIQPDSPLLVQFGFFVMNGISWQVIFGTIGKAAGM